ncbi:MAG: PAS domain S-box protein [Paludibacter sp.]|nr:PAS domain S-box protein [Paludibacter sp.]
MATILLLDIIDSLNIDEIIKLLENLSGVFGLVLKNSLNYLDLKEKADERAKELSTSEESLRAVFQGNFSAIAIIDADTTIYMVNDAYCKMSGYSKEEIIGTSWTNQIPPPDLERLQEYNRIRKTNLAGAPEKYEFSIYRKDGNVRHCLMSVSVIEHTNRIVASFVDITERYEGEKRRKLGENRLESLLRINQFKFENTQELLDYTLTEVITLTESQFGYIYYYNDQTKEFTLNSWSNEVMNNCSVANPQTLYHLEKTGIWGEAVRQAKPIIVNDFQAPHPLMKGLPEGHARLHKFLSIPVFNNGHIVAVVGVANKKTDYNQTDIVQLNLMMDAVWQLTEKKRAEDELMVSEKQNSSILKTALDGFWKVNMNGQFLFVNDAYCKMTGYSNEELLNMSIKDVDINDNGEDIQNRLILLVQQKSDRFSSKHRCKNGNIIDVLINISYLPDEDIIFVFVQDITQNILNEKKIVESEKRFKMLYNNAPLSYQSLDKEARFLDVNDIWLSTFGYNRDEVIGHYFAEFMSPDSASIVQSKFAEFIKNGELHNYIFDMVRKDGTIITVTYEGAIGYDEYGHFKQTHCIFKDVTEIQKAEKKLRESEQKFRDIFDSSMVGKSTTTLDGQLDVNTAFCKILGYSKEDLNAINWRNITHEEDIEKNEKIVLSILNGEVDAERWEKRFIHKDGHIIWGDINTVLKRDSSGNPLYFITEIVDISQRKQAEKELQESEEKFRNFFEYSVIGMSIASLDGTMKANKAFSDIVGYTKEELSKTKWETITHKDDLEYNFKVIDRLLKGETNSERWEKRYIHKDGHIVWIDISITLQRDEKGQPLYIITGINDISEKKKAEAKLKESEERFKTLFEKAPLGYHSLNKEGNIINVNETWLDTLGYKKEEVLGKSFGDFMTEKSLENFKNCFPKLKELGRYNSEFELIKKNGSTITAAFVGKSSYTTSGEFTRTHAVFQDVTEQRKMEKSLADSERRFRVLLSTVKLVSVLFDLNGNITFCNDFTLELTHWTKEEVIGKNWFNLFLPKEINEKVKNEFAESLINGQIISNYENLILTKEKEEILVSWTNTWLYDNDGNINGIASLGVDVTEQRKAELSIRKSKNRLNRAEFASMSGNWELVLANGIIKASKGATKLYGVNIGESKYERIKNIPLPEYRPLMDKALKDLLKSDIPYDIDFKIKKADTGEIRDIHSTAVFDKEQQIIFGVIRDVTEQKKTEEALKKSAKLLSDTEKIGKVGGWEFNIDTSELLWTEETYDIHDLPYTTSSSVEDGINYYTQDCIPIIKRALERAIKYGEPFDLELEIITAKKNRKNVHTIGRIDNENRRIFGFFQDITERKLNERALKESEEKLSALFTGMSEMVATHELVFDESGWAIDYKIIECNEAFVKIIGIKREDLTGKFATEVYQTAEAPYLNEYADVCLSGENLDFKTYYQPLDKYFQISIVSLGKNRFATITADITEIQKAQEALLAKNKELENYMYVASHDLRSPLVNIQGFSQRLQRQTNELTKIISSIDLEKEKMETIETLMNENLPKSLNYILTNVSKMDQLINGLLQLSRSGRIEMSIQQLRMNELIKKIVSTFNYQLTECEATVEIDELQDCYGDENQLNQVFSNIISNAIKYRNRENQLRIEISAKLHFNKVIYSIKDNGIGIDPNFISKIWSVFYRIDPKPEISGEGLGLSLAKQIVEKHKGRIWVESSPGNGSVFYIELQQNDFVV